MHHRKHLVSNSDRRTFVFNLMVTCMLTLSRLSPLDHEKLAFMMNTVIVISIPLVGTKP